MRGNFPVGLCVGIMMLCARATLAQPATTEEKPALPAPQQQEKELDLPRSSDPGKQPFLRNFAYYEWRMISSPFRRANYDAPALKKYIIPFALISATLIATDKKTASFLPNTDDQAVWSGRVSEFGATYTLAGFSGGMYLVGKMVGDKHARETGWISLEALAHTQLLIFGLKQAANRLRPESDDPPRGFWKGGDSFPSGHSASAFAVATVFAYEYRHHIAVPITAYSLASVIAISRLSARRHWASDIFAGGSMGFLIGRYIYKQRHDPNLPGSIVRKVVSNRLIPDVGFGLYGPTLSWKL